MTVDLEAQEITGPGWRQDLLLDRRNSSATALLNGLDDIGLTLEKASAIDAYEKKTASSRPWADAPLDLMRHMI